MVQDCVCAPLTVPLQSVSKSTVVQADSSTPRKYVSRARDCRRILGLRQIHYRHDGCNWKQHTKCGIVRRFCFSITFEIHDIVHSFSHKWITIWSFSIIILGIILGSVIISKMIIETIVNLRRKISKTNITFLLSYKKHRITFLSRTYNTVLPMVRGWVLLLV